MKSRRAIKELIQRGEGTKLEFKEKANSPEKILNELVAFANTEGGVLLIGISDRGKVKGLRDVESEAELMKGLIETRIWPELDYEIDFIQMEEDKTIVYIETPTGMEKPYSVHSKDAAIKTSYYRIGEESIKMGSISKAILLGRQKKRSGVLRYNETHKKLFSILEKEELNFYAIKKSLKIPGRDLKRMLILLGAMNIIGVNPKEEGDFFFLKEPQS